MNRFIKIVSNTIYQGVGRLITATTSLLITILVARSFGSANLGDLTKVLVFVALFYLVADFGFNAIVVKEMKVQKSKAGYLIANLFVLRFLFSLALVFLVCLIVLALPFNLQTNIGFSPLVKAGIVLGSLTIITQALLTSANAYFQANLRYAKSALAVFGGSLATVFLAFALVKFFSSSWPQAFLSIIAAYVVGGAVTVVLAIFLIIFELPIGKLRIDFSFWYRLFRRTWPIGLTLIFNLIYFRADTLILAATRSSSEVGLYSLAYKMFDLALVLPIFLINASYPTMIETYQKGVNYLRQFSKIFFLALLAISFLVLVFLLVTAPILVGLAGGGGKGFAGSIPALQILAISVPVFYISALLMWLLILFEKQKSLVYIYGSGALLNIFLNLIFIPRFGYLAAAATTGFCEFLIVVISAYLVLKNFKD